MNNNPERILDRLDELYSCLDEFPESELRHVWESAIEELKKQAVVYC